MAKSVLDDAAVYLTAVKVCERYGVSAMTLWRWVREPSLKFPQPVYMGRLRFWRVEDLAAWEATRPSGATRTLALANAATMPSVAA